LTTRGGAVAARVAHNHEVAGSSPVPATMARICGVKEAPQIKLHKKSLAITGTLFGLSYGAYILALSTGPLAYVTALRSSSALLIGSLIGFRLLKEAFTKPKAIALLLILAGSALLALG
jgi:drug/metabolite transporter (DMT)-like permease